MRKLLGVVTTFTLLFVIFFGLNLSMKTHEDGNMPKCPFMMGQSSVCQMSTPEHILRWQQMFFALPQLAYFLIVIAVFTFVFRFLIPQFTLAPPAFLNFRTYKLNHPDSKLFNYLLLAFSDGILHPKIYN